MEMMVGDAQNQNQGQADILSATSSSFTKTNLALTFLALRRKTTMLSVIVYIYCLNNK